MADSAQFFRRRVNYDPFAAICTPRWQPHQSAAATCPYKSSPGSNRLPRDTLAECCVSIKQPSYYVPSLNYSRIELIFAVLSNILLILYITQSVYVHIISFILRSLLSLLPKTGTDQQLLITKIYSQ